MRNAIAFSAAILLAAQPHAALSQSGVVEGSVSTDSLGKHSLPGAEVSIPALQITTHANFAGEYRLPGIAPGRYLAIATAAGYRSVGDSVTIAAGTGNFHDFVLVTRAVVLDSVVSKAAAPRAYISPGLNGFEERRLSGKGGYFVPDSIFRKEEDRTLADVIVAHVPGVLVFRPGGSTSYIASGRGPSASALSGKSAQCYPDVYLDGVMLAPVPEPYLPKGATNLSHYSSTELGAMEFYPGGASLPIQFNHTASGCGALLLWTREK